MIKDVLENLDLAIRYLMYLRIENKKKERFIEIPVRSVPRLGRLFFTSCWYDEELQSGLDKLFCRSIRHNERKCVNCNNGASDLSLKMYIYMKEGKNKRVDEISRDNLVDNQTDRFIVVL